MKDLLRLSLSTGFVAVIAFGCQSEPAPDSVTSSAGKSESGDVAHDSHGDENHDDHGTAESDVKAALGSLSEEDRKVAEGQKFCAVMDKHLLGSMGTPIKLDISGEPVFICCAGCKSRAMKNPEATLARVAELKAENSAAPAK